MPIIIPYVVLVISFYLIIGPIIDKPTIEYLYATLFIFGGMVFYVPFVHYKMRIPFMGTYFFYFDKFLIFFSRRRDCFLANDIWSSSNFYNVGIKRQKAQISGSGSWLQVNLLVSSIQHYFCAYCEKKMCRWN